MCGPGRAGARRVRQEEAHLLRVLPPCWAVGWGVGCTASRRQETHLLRVLPPYWAVGWGVGCTASGGPLG